MSPIDLDLDFLHGGDDDFGNDLQIDNDPPKHDLFEHGEDDLKSDIDIVPDEPEEKSHPSLGQLNSKLHGVLLIHFVTFCTCAYTL